jgi:hypothetical protein
MIHHPSSPYPDHDRPGDHHDGPGQAGVPFVEEQPAKRARRKKIAITEGTMAIVVGRIDRDPIVGGIRMAS